MKKYIAAALTVALCFAVTACGRVALPGQQAESVTASVAAIPSQTQVRTAFEKAMEVYGWFDLCALESDSAEKAKLGDVVYYRVLSDEVQTYDALRTMVYDLFDTPIGDKLLQADSETPPYIDVAGVLYGQDFARASDVTKGEYELTVEQESKTCWLCKARVETIELNDAYKDYRRVSGYADYVYRYELVGNRWVFTDFELFY